MFIGRFEGKIDEFVGLMEGRKPRERSKMKRKLRGLKEGSPYFRVVPSFVFFP